MKFRRFGRLLVITDRNWSGGWFWLGATDEFAVHIIGPLWLVKKAAS